MPQARNTAEVTGRDGLLVVLLAFAWGGNWIAVAMGVQGGEPPWGLRCFSSSLGGLTLMAAALLTGRSLKVPRGQRIHVMVPGFLNVVCFQMFSAFAQLHGATSRVVILTYTMPVWTAILSHFVLGERLDTVRRVSILLCIAGLSVLIWPLVMAGVPWVALLALGCAWVWTGAIVYLKWAQPTVPPLTSAAWQLMFGFCFIAVGALVFEGPPRVTGLSNETWAAILFMGTIGTGFAHFLWWSIAARLSAVTASIGSLLVPVIGVIGSSLLLGERPTVNDMVGFVLILGAASCVLLLPALRGARA
jgi:drug/metabolite transporter (DMT)-like permease